MKNVIIILLTCTTLFSFSAFASNGIPSFHQEDFYLLKDVLPSSNAIYPGGENAWNAYIKNSIEYPALAQENGIEGEVVLNFIINEKGELEKYTIVKSLGYGCDEAVIQLLNTMPQWTPATYNGDLVAASRQLRMEFKLR